VVVEQLCGHLAKGIPLLRQAIALGGQLVAFASQAIPFRREALLLDVDLVALADEPGWVASCSAQTVIWTVP
jgi:hypothetical protein